MPVSRTGSAAVRQPFRPARLLIRRAKRFFHPARATEWAVSIGQEWSKPGRLAPQYKPAELLSMHGARGWPGGCRIRNSRQAPASPAAFRHRTSLFEYSLADSRRVHALVGGFSAVKFVLG